MKKTFKREVAIAGLAYWVFATGYLYWFADPDRVKALERVYEAQTWTAWTYAAAAFGLHALATQWGSRS